MKQIRKKLKTEKKHQKSIKNTKKQQYPDKRLPRPPQNGGQLSPLVRRGPAEDAHRQRGRCRPWLPLQRPLQTPLRRYQRHPTPRSLRRAKAKI